MKVIISEPFKQRIPANKMSLHAVLDVSLAKCATVSSSDNCTSQLTSLEQFLGLSKAQNHQVPDRESEKALSIQGFLGTGASLHDLVDSAPHSPSIACFSEESEIGCSVEEYQSVEEFKCSPAERDTRYGGIPNRIGELDCFSPGLHLEQTKFQDQNPRLLEIKPLTSFKALNRIISPVMEPRRTTYLKQIQLVQIFSPNYCSWEDPVLQSSHEKSSKVQSVRQNLIQVALMPKLKDSQKFVNYVNEKSLEPVLLQ